jgi:beta-N-acetylhexosaminidase
MSIIWTMLIRDVGIMNKKYQNKMPNEILSNMTLREKAAQTIVPPYRNRDFVDEAIKNGVGGIWPTWHFGNNSDSAEFAKDMDRLQAISEIPLFITADMETGVGQLIHDGLYAEFPELMALGAVASIEEAEMLAYEQGKAMALGARSIGWNMTPTPVVDVNIYAENPITNIRSVGEDPERVARITSSMIKGMQEGHAIIPMAKHFPGAGMQRDDSHFSMEKTSASIKEMEDIHLYPFRKAIEQHVKCIMTNHAVYPAYDSENTATLSKKIVTNLLREKMGYKGLVMTDAMGMSGLTSQAKGHESTILALLAGNDLILAPHDPIGAIDAIVEAVKAGRMSEDYLNTIVLRILEAKEWLGLFKDRLVEFSGLSGWNTAEKIAKNSVTLIRGNDYILPLTPEKKLMVLEPAHPRRQLDIGLYTNTTLIYDHLKEFYPNAKFSLFADQMNEKQIQELLEKASLVDAVVVGTSFRSYAGQVGLLTTAQINLLQRIKGINPNMIAVVSNPYVSAEIDFIGTVLCCYSTSKVAIKAAIDVLRGVCQAKGLLPVTIPSHMDPSYVKILHHD